MSKWAALIQEAASTDETDIQHIADATLRRSSPDGSQITTDSSQTRIYPPSPIAITLLLVCCQRLEANREEIATELLKLKDLTPEEQIQRWLSACTQLGIQPEEVFPVGVVSNTQAADCMSCKHLEMIFASRRGERKRYHWSCTKQHAILEACYLGERVLLAPETCTDYLSSSSSPI